MNSTSPMVLTYLLILIELGGVLPASAKGHGRDAGIRPLTPAIKPRAESSSSGRSWLFAVAAPQYLGQRGSISGQVVLPSGQEVRARIKITLSGYRLGPLTTYTDNKGRFAFQSISDGTYTITVEGESNLYELVAQEVRVFYGASNPLVITLKRKLVGVASQKLMWCLSPSSISRYLMRQGRN